MEIKNKMLKQIIITKLIDAGLSLKAAELILDYLEKMYVGLTSDIETLENRILALEDSLRNTSLTATNLYNNRN
jgi:hypothetical protein